jgi:hypothetical protein
MRQEHDSVRSDSPALNEEEDKPEEPEIPQLSITIAIVTLLISTVLVALNAEYLVDSINAITCGSSGISKNFVGLILLPIVGNAAEHATAVTVAVKDKMDLAIGVAVGSSMQIALLVLPFAVVLGWILGKDMTLDFDGFQIAVLFVAVLLVNYLIQDGKSHWLEGVLLMTLYIIIAVAAWYEAYFSTSFDKCANETTGSIPRILRRMVALPNDLFLSASQDESHHRWGSPCGCGLRKQQYISAISCWFTLEFHDRRSRFVTRYWPSRTSIFLHFEWP